MTDLNEWLQGKEAEAKKLHPELAANAAKIKGAQDPNKKGAEKPDLYAPGKGRGKGGKLASSEKVAGTVYDANDQSFMDWLKDKGDLGLNKEAAGETNRLSSGTSAQNAVLKAVGVTVPATVVATLGAQKVIKMIKERKKKDGEKTAGALRGAARGAAEGALGGGVAGGAFGSGVAFGREVSGKSPSPKRTVKDVAGGAVLGAVPGAIGGGIGGDIKGRREAKAKAEKAKAKEAPAEKKAADDSRKKVKREAVDTMARWPGHPIGRHVASKEVARGRLREIRRESGKVRGKYMRRGALAGAGLGAIAAPLIAAKKGKPVVPSAIGGAGLGAILGGSLGHSQATHVGTQRGLSKHDKEYLESRGYKTDRYGDPTGERMKKSAADGEQQTAGAGGASPGVLKGIQRMGNKGANMAAMATPIGAPMRAMQGAKSMMGKAAAFVQHKENTDLLRRLVGKVQAESADAQV
jgi:hypothetical protein